MSNPASVTLKIVSAVVIGGHIVKPGDLVEVSVSEAKDLLNRGRAVTATDEDVQSSSKPPQPSRTIRAKASPTRASMGSRPPIQAKAAAKAAAPAPAPAKAATAPASAPAASKPAAPAKAAAAATKTVEAKEVKQ
jgi:hypothetical protein